MIEENKNKYADILKSFAKAFTDVINEVEEPKKLKK